MYNFTLKKWLAKPTAIKHVVLCCLVLIFGLSTQSFYAQDVGSSSVQANFGIDGDVYSGVLQFPNNEDPLVPLPAPGGTDDWFQGPSGLGVIDELGSANLGNPLSDPNPPNSTDNVAIELRQSVWQLNSPFPFPLVNGDLWLDAVYGRDNYVQGGSAENSYFSSGADKNSDNPINWSLDSGGSVPQKTDIVDVYAHLRGDGPKAPTELDPRPFTTLYAYAGASLVVTNGNKHLDFEFFREGLETAADLQDPTKLGPDGGRTAWTFDGTTGDIMVPGTIIVSVDYINGGTVPDIRIRVWIDQATYDGAATFNTLAQRPFNIDESVAFETGTGSDGFGYAAINPLAVGTSLWGRVNDDFASDAGSLTTGPPWGTWEGSTPDFVSDYERYQFVEIGINLTAFGLDRRGQEDPCSNILGSLLVKTRSSGGGPNEGAFGSELKDFAGPYLFGFTGEEPVITVANKAVCASDGPVDITAGNSVNPPGDIEYFLDDTYTTSVPSPGAYDAPLGETTIYVRSEKAGFPGCYGYNEFTVTVNANPAPSVDDEAECEGDTATFMTTALGAGFTYQWYKNDVAIGGATSNSYTTGALTLAESGDVYKVVVTDTNNSTNCTGEDSGTLTVNTNPAPSVDDEAECEGDTATFMTANLGAGFTYQWYLNDVAIGGATSNSYTTGALTLAEDGDVYKVVVTNDSQTCSGEDSGTLSVNANPAPSVDDEAECEGDTATFMTTALGAGFTYQWYKNDVAIGGATSNSYTTGALTLAESGDVYKVVVTDTNNSTN
ncbi:hypothetical protein ACIEHO_16190, partial [Jejuia sp. DST062]